jgi:hypothetical protein
VTSNLRQSVALNNHTVPVYVGMTQNLVPEDAPRLEKVLITPDILLTECVVDYISGTAREILAKISQNTSPEHVHV